MIKNNDFIKSGKNIWSLLLVKGVVLCHLQAALGEKWAVSLVGVGEGEFCSQHGGILLDNLLFSRHK